MAIAPPIPFTRRRRAARAARAAPTSLSEHLGELRRRIVISAVALAVGATVMFVLYSHVLSFLLHPYCASVGHHGPCVLYVTGPLDGLAIRVKVAAYGGLLLGLAGRAVAVLAVRGPRTARRGAPLRAGPS